MVCRRSVWIAIIGFVAFYQWLRHQRRVLIHRERLIALEKGVELPPWSGRRSAARGMPSSSSCWPA